MLVDMWVAEIPFFEPAIRLAPVDGADRPRPTLSGLLGVGQADVLDYFDSLGVLLSGQPPVLER